MSRVPLQTLIASIHAMDRAASVMNSHVEVPYAAIVDLRRAIADLSYYVEPIAKAMGVDVTEPKS